MNPGPLWRVFPWDWSAAEDERFSASLVPGGQGRNRFDLRGSALGVIYCAGSEEHAVAEMIQGYWNSSEPLTNDDLTVWGHRYALVSVCLASDLWPRIENLCAPAVLSELQITADPPAYRDRGLAQQIAETHFSATDPDARLYRKGGRTGARLVCLVHDLIDTKKSRDLEAQGHAGDGPCGAGHGARDARRHSGGEGRTGTSQPAGNPDRRRGLWRHRADHRSDGPRHRPHVPLLADEAPEKTPTWTRRTFDLERKRARQRKVKEVEARNRVRQLHRT